MAFYVASLLTFMLMIVWGFVRFAVWPVPTRLYQWVSGQPWGTAPWLEGFVHWFTIPLAWLLVLLALWGVVVIVFGRPSAVLAGCGLEELTAVPAERVARARGFRRSFWLVWFKLTYYGDAGRRPRPHEGLWALTWLGALLTAAACVFEIFAPGGRFVWAGTPAVPLACAFVAVGMSVSYRATERLTAELGGAGARTAEAERPPDTGTVEAAKDDVLAALHDVTAEPMLGVSSDEGANE